jgi:predicted ATP-grasp superfamily ATP-dependent carboligase
MRTSVLLVAAATKWLATARMPSALHKAGFDVSLLAPKDSLAERSRFVQKVGHIADRAAPAQWIFAFAAMVKAVSPRVVIPCDDTSLRLLQLLVLSPPNGMQPALYSNLATLVRESLGNPANYRASVDKTLLPPAAEALGVRVPPYAVVAGIAGARAFAEAQGYPVVVKRGFGAGGEWVAIVSDAGDLARTFSRFAAATTLDLEGPGGARMLVQRHISGKIVLQSMVAWNGMVLAGFAREKVVAHPPTGPSTVVRCMCAPEVRHFSELLATGLEMNGFFGVECIIDDHAGETWLLEINRRITNGIPLGAMINVDLCAALHGAINGEPRMVRADLADGEEHLIAHFPQEWLRDPASRYLKECRVDAPWDDPGVLEAMLALRHDG